jgi:secondary thiamine-phosphate synthase enzyme
MLQKLTIPTNKPREVIDITGIINDLLSKNFFIEGLCFIYCTDTTSAVTTADIDSDQSIDDYLAAFEELKPKIAFKHPHNPAHFADHFLSSVVGTSLFVPVQSANLVLGTNQKIIFVEFAGPGVRHLNFTFLKEEVTMAL